jgi:uncharacterized protein YlzI (FlbEa/FlbD family)
MGLFVFERLYNQKGVTEEEEQDVLQKIKDTKKKMFINFERCYF